MKKTCKGCGKEKVLAAFYPEKTGKYGRRSRCIPCYNTYTAELRHADPASREKQRAAAARWRRRNPAAAKASSLANQRRHMAELRGRVRAVLGGKCALCPATAVELLHIDHTNDDGHLHRGREVFASRTSFLNFVLMRPDEFQLLCANCNHRKRLAASPGPGTRQSAYTLKYAAKLRMAALAVLGGRCRCGETDTIVLCIDHARGGGRRDRSALGGSAAMYRDVPVNPTKYQILCHNCNWLKRHENKEWGAYCG